jgi:hypothetical protein
MKLRCSCCQGPLGLGFRSKVIWENNVWGYRRFRLCGIQCIDQFMQSRETFQAEKKLALRTEGTSAVESYLDRGRKWA